MLEMGIAEVSPFRLSWVCASYRLDAVGLALVGTHVIWWTQPNFSNFSPPHVIWWIQKAHVVWSTLIRVFKVFPSEKPYMLFLQNWFEKNVSRGLPVLWKGAHLWTFLKSHNWSRIIFILEINWNHKILLKWGYFNVLEKFGSLKQTQLVLNCLSCLE